uniref:Uncharacterized protein n=1 Tax=Monodelphis domestica TaxID=13616 RepID=A0A5F8GN78_MONDO
MEFLHFIIPLSTIVFHHQQIQNLSSLSPIEGHPLIFQFFATTKSTAINIFVQRLVAGPAPPTPRRTPPVPPRPPPPRFGRRGGVGGGEARGAAGRRPAGERREGERRRLVQPRRAPSPASRPSPTDPALRANPYPEVTDPACRLPLPTLFQHARGCSPWRPAADMGTARREIYTLSPGFSRASESSPDAAGTATLSKARAPLSGRTHSRAALPFTKKRELSPGLPPASPGSVALPHWTPHGARLRHSGFGDLNPTPFRSAEGNGGHRPSLRNGARLSLRTD